MTEAQEFLMQIRKCDSLINRKMAKKAALYDMITRTTPSMKSDVVSGGGDHDRMAGAIAKMIDLEEEINRDIDRYVDLQREAEKLLDKVAEKNARHHELLCRRYISYESFDHIAAEMGYAATRGATKLHGRALQTLQKILDEEKEGV